MPDIGSGLHAIIEDRYASALCMTCTWKLSGADERDTPAIVRRDATAIESAAQLHAESSGHEVSLCITLHRTFDFRVERMA